MQRLQAVAAGNREMAEDDRGQEDDDESAGDAGQEAHHEKDPDGVGEAHEPGKDRAGAQSAQHERPLATMRPAAGGGKGAKQIAEIIGRGDQAGIAGGKVKRLHHAGQDRRIDEAADAHGDGHRDHAGEGKPQRRWRGRVHCSAQ